MRDLEEFVSENDILFIVVGFQLTISYFLVKVNNACRSMIGTRRGTYLEFSESSFAA